MTMKMLVKVTIYKNRYISVIMQPIYLNFHRNDATWADNKSVTSADLEHVGEGHIS